MRMIKDEQLVTCCYRNMQEMSKCYRCKSYWKIMDQDESERWVSKRRKQKRTFKPGPMSTKYRIGQKLFDYNTPLLTQVSYFVEYHRGERTEMTSEKAPHDSIECPATRRPMTSNAPMTAKKEERIFIRSGRTSASVPPLPCIPRGEALKIEPLG
jgi:hypothetical protein